MKASELIKAGAKVGDKLYFCVRTKVDEFEIFHINEGKNIVCAYAEGLGSITLSDWIDQGYELSRQAAIENRLHMLDAWRKEVEELESKL